MARKIATSNRSKPRVAIVGAGNLASALAMSLRKAGYGVDVIVSRDNATSLKRARRLANGVGASAAPVTQVRLAAGVVWFCVPDAAIAAAAKALTGAADWKGKIALHSSGALGSDELGALKRRGASIASVHPLMTFVRGAQPSLTGVPFAAEGDATAVRMAREIVRGLGGRAHTIRTKDKAAYHAWGTFASPLLTALLSTSEHVAAAAGVPRKEPRQRMLPILKQTLQNYAALGAAGAFSGPIIRGDVDTVKRHLRVLRAEPLAQAVYLSLARAALAYLPRKNKKKLEEALHSSRRKRR
jgi:predicted short-subunit dehydrogenase-like oxidoreductase (DUF2520 family)